MAGVLPFLLVPQAVWWLPPDFDPEVAQAQAAHFAEEAGWRVVDSKGTLIVPRIRSVSYDWPLRNDPRRSFNVDFGVGRVSIETRTGKIAWAYHLAEHAASPALPTPLTRQASERIALNAIRKYGWTGKIKPSDGKQWGNLSQGRLRFAYLPEALGFRVGGPGIKVEVDPKLGAIVSFSCALPSPPESFKNSLSVRQVRRDFYEQVARTYGQSELFGSAEGQWYVSEPPHPRSAFSREYRQEHAKGTGIVTFSLGVHWPSSTRPGERNQATVRYDAQRGTLTHEQYTSAENLVSIGVPPGAFPAPKREWPKSVGPVEVYTDRGTRFAHGIIEPLKTHISSYARPVTLQFRDRVMFARYDAPRNVLQVGDRTGRPSANIAEALRAVTR